MESKLKSGIIVALLMVLVAFGAAAKGQKEAPKTDTTLDKSQYYEINMYYDPFDPKEEQYADKSSFRKFLKEKFNFGYKTLASPGDPMEKLTLMLAAGDYPDLVRIYNSEMLKAYIKAGAVLDLGALADAYGPNFKKRREENFPIYQKLSGMDDGKVYMYDYGADNSSGTAQPWLEWAVRSDLFAQQGYPDIVNEYDLLAVLKKGLQDNPKTDGRPTVGIAYPYAQPSGALCMTYLVNLGKFDHQSFNHGMEYDFDLNRWIDPIRYYSFKDGLKFFNTTYREGVLDREFLTDTYDMYAAKMKEGRALSNWFKIWQLSVFNNTLQQGGKSYRYVPYPIQLKSMVEKGEPKAYMVASATPWDGMVITKNAKYPARLMEVLDYCASEEGDVRMGWGELGKQYTMQNGRRVPTQEFIDKTLASDPLYPYTFKANVMFGGNSLLDANGQNYSIYLDSDVAALTLDPVVKKVMGQYGWKNYSDMYSKNKNFKYIPGLPMDFKNVAPTLTDTQVKNWERIDALTREYVAKVVVAGSDAEFERMFQEWTAKRDGYGFQEMLASWDKEYADLRKKYGLK